MARGIADEPAFLEAEVSLIVVDISAGNGFDKRCP
jgi:hypothetical protein